MVRWLDFFNSLKEKIYTGKTRFVSGNCVCFRERVGKHVYKWNGFITVLLSKKRFSITVYNSKGNGCFDENISGKAIDLTQQQYLCIFT